MVLGKVLDKGKISTDRFKNKQCILQDDLLPFVKVSYDNGIRLPALDCEDLC